MDRYIKCFIETIEEYIAENNTTKTAFARELGCRDYCVIRWLNGTNIPSTEYVIMVADFLKCSVDYLLGTVDDDIYRGSEHRDTFANRFVLMQKKSGESMNKLAKICGVTRQTYQSGY